MLDSPAIVRSILEGYTLPHRGDHGVVHWARVLENGVRLAESTGADVEVVTLFALFHDARRVNQYRDDGHGRRGAELARAFRGDVFDLGDRQAELLFEACRLHTDGLTDADMTIQTCWDADRLDLGRVGIIPRPHRLCTDAARALLDWAHRRAQDGYEPDFVSRQWAV